MIEKKPGLGITVEEQPENLFDLLYITLPLPHLALIPVKLHRRIRALQLAGLRTLRSMVDESIERREATDKPKRKVQRVEIE